MQSTMVSNLGRTSMRSITQFQPEKTLKKLKRCLEKYYKGEIKLGGCMVAEGDPDYHCKKCTYEWNKDNPHIGHYADSDEEE